MEPVRSLTQYVEEHEQYLRERAKVFSHLESRINPDRMIHLALSCGRRNPELFQCTRPSWILALLDAAFFGIEPNPLLGHGYLIPFRNKHNDNKLEVQFMIGYKGKIALIEEAGLATNIQPRVVYDCDVFEMHPHLEWEGKAPFIHEPDIDRDSDAALRGVYATAVLPTGDRKFIYLPKSGRQSVEYYRSKSRGAASQFSPWTTSYEAMAMKTAVHRLCDTMAIRADSKLAIARELESDVDDEVRHTFQIKEDGTVLKDLAR